MFRALVRRDGEYEGVFVAGVDTTGIFCRPTCPARKPRPEHVRFFAGARDALLAGFRPCLRCRPELAPGLSLVDSSQVLAQHAARLIEQAARSGDDPYLPDIARRLGVTDRHLRRIF
ncbi:MAG: methylphosphotriester-DNA--protein-cysteine methyltransferase family protein, partial [Planctomycetota bacterium]|nr:methylphosphotriester-DNA--protein-cysteine methyltransferase family protein [Planctomycetota bacterium]